MSAPAAPVTVPPEVAQAPPVPAYDLQSNDPKLFPGVVSGSSERRRSSVLRTEGGGFRGREEEEAMESSLGSLRGMRGDADNNQAVVEDKE